MIKFTKDSTAAKMLGALGLYFTIMPPKAGPITNPNLDCEKNTEATNPKAAPITPIPCALLDSSVIS